MLLCPPAMLRILAVIIACGSQGVVLGTLSMQARTARTVGHEPSLCAAQGVVPDITSALTLLLRIAVQDPA